MRSPFGTLAALATPRTTIPDVPIRYSAGRQSLFGQSPYGDQGDPERQMASYGAVGTLFAIVNRTSNSVAALKWRLWRKAASGKAEDRTEVMSHAALTVWNKPNHFYTQNMFVETFSQHLDLTGEGWWVYSYDPRFKIPIEIWPVRPDRMMPIPSATKFLAGYEYMSPDGERVPLDLSQVTQLKMPNPRDPYRGIGPVQALLADLDSVRFSTEWNRNFFYNSAEPGGIIELDRRLADDEWSEMRMRWNEQHKGIANAHRVALLEQGRWVDRKITQRDMQFAELNTLSREVIREAFGFPKSMLGSTEDVNRANAEAGELMFGRWLVVPRAERMKAALNFDFLPKFPGTDDLEFDYDNPVTDDQEVVNATLLAAAQSASALVRVGYDSDDVASACGLPDMRWKAPVVPAGNDPAADPTLDPNDPASQPDTAARALRLGPVPDAATDARGGAFRIVATRLRAAASEHQAAWLAQRDRTVATWQDEIKPDQRDQLAQQIQTAVDRDDAAALGTLAVSTTAAAALLTTAMVAMGAAGATAVVNEASEQGVNDVAPVEPSHDALAAEAVAFAALLGIALAAFAGREALRQRAPGRTGAEVAETVSAAIDALAGTGPGGPVDSIGAALSLAQNAGRTATLLAAPVANRYRATEADDTNTCAPCARIDGHEFDTLDDARNAYPIIGYDNCQGRDRCRGTFLPIWEVAP